MPAVSPKQQRYMAMCAHNPEAARGKCPPKSVAKEFAQKPAGGYEGKGATKGSPVFTPAELARGYRKV